MLGQCPEALLHDEHLPGQEGWLHCDLAPFVRLAFPQPPTRHSVLTPAQRAFLSALLANGKQPFDEALCRALLGT